MTFDEVVEIELVRSGGTVSEISERLTERLRKTLKRMVDQGKWLQTGTLAEAAR